MSVVVIAEGLKEFQRFVEQLPGIARKAARIAINDTADDARKKAIPDAIEAEIAFPSGYLSDDRRLSVSDRATDGKLQATIEGRERPTSLARFAPGASLGNRTAKVRLRVNPGRSKTLKEAFLVRLRSGKTLTEDRFNIGLAVRIKPGTTLSNRHLGNTITNEIFPNVFLLYGPSVAQVFANVADDIAPTLIDNIELEFTRQFVRLANE